MKKNLLLVALVAIASYIPMNYAVSYTGSKDNPDDIKITIDVLSNPYTGEKAFKLELYLKKIILNLNTETNKLSQTIASEIIKQIHDEWQLNKMYMNIPIEDLWVPFTLYTNGKKYTDCIGWNDKITQLALRMPEKYGLIIDITRKPAKAPKPVKK